MRSAGALPLLLGAGTALALFQYAKSRQRSQTIDNVFMQAQASQDPEFVEQAVVVMRANGKEPAAQILEIHLRALKGAA